MKVGNGELNHIKSLPQYLHIVLTVLATMHICKGME
jgi:hypothetical protein